MSFARRNFIALDHVQVAMPPGEEARARAFYVEALGMSELEKPPSLAKREVERGRAIRAYGKLAADGIKHLSDGGILVACSCSAHVGAEEFFEAVRHSAARAGRRLVELRTTRHAPDHPATFKEAEYLKGIFLRLR